MIKIALTGANGEVGKWVADAIEESKEASLTLKIGSDDSKDLLLQSRRLVDVLIDFTTPTATLEYLEMARQLQIPMVIGTTGFSVAEKAIIRQMSHNIPIVFSPNMSVGVNITYQLLAVAAGILKEKADVGITDIHRRHKKDAPSGTALQMGEVIQKSSHAPEKIQYSSLRLGDTVGDHNVKFCWEGEELEITHRASSRASFAKGALKAAEWVIDKEPGLYSMQDVLELA